jgi:quercetin dioxygenase-like cupin family protein
VTAPGDRIRADFSRPELVRVSREPWTAAPAPGVARCMLDRVGGELARATTVVRYQPGCRFPAHEHPLGEEFLVLEGVFEDELGEYPAGTYVRNPPGSRHAPGAARGCTILVKLMQFAPDDRRRVCIDTRAAAAQPVPGVLGVHRLPLFEARHERVRLEYWAPGAQPDPDTAAGCELFVLDGSLAVGGEPLGRWDWLRLPPGSPWPEIRVSDPAALWIKSGHLGELAAADR